MIIKSTSNLWHVDFKRKIFQKHKQQQNREFAKKKEEKKRKTSGQLKSIIMGCCMSTSHEPYIQEYEPEDEAGIELGQ